MTSPIPLGRLGEPEEIAHAVGFIFENDLFTGRCAPGARARARRQRRRWRGARGRSRQLRARLSRAAIS